MGKRFSLDGEAVELAEFLADNAEGIGSDEIAQIHALRVNDTMHFGGGAGARFALTRLPDSYSMIPPFKDAAEDRAATEANRIHRLGQPPTDLALQEKADAEWDRAWDRAEAADKKAGRPYNRHVYAEKASIARAKVLAGQRAA